MNNWMENEKWLKKVKDENLYLMRDHNYAFSAWEIEGINGGVDKNAFLVHVDSHLDDIPESIDIPGILDEIDTKEDAIVIADKYDYSNIELPDRIYMGIDNFIWPSIIRNTIGNVIFISDDEQEELNESNLKRQIEDSYSDYNRNDIRNDRNAKILLKNLESHNKSINRYQSIEEFDRNGGISLIEKSNQKLILDLDLDYFNDSKRYNSEPNLKDEVQIVNNLEYLRDVANWDAITVALSPEHCGGEEPCEYLLSLFLKIFNINTKDLIDW